MILTVLLAPTIRVTVHLAHKLFSYTLMLLLSEEVASILVLQQPINRITHAFPVLPLVLTVNPSHIALTVAMDIFFIKELAYLFARMEHSQFWEMTVALIAKVHARPAPEQQTIALHA